MPGEALQQFGLTRERIRQIEVTALRKLRHPSRRRQLRDFLEYAAASAQGRPDRCACDNLCPPTGLAAS